MPGRAPAFPLIAPGAFLRRAEARSLRVARLLRAAGRPSSASPELLHDLHREVRRARFDLRLLRRGATVGVRGRLQEAEDQLTSQAKVTGEARDRDVLGALLLELRPRLGPAARRELEAWTRELAREAREERRRIQQEAKVWLAAGSPRLAPGTGGAPQGPSPRGFERSARQELRQAEEDVERARSRTLRRPTVRRLHRLRIAVRRLRQLRVALARRPREGELPLPWKRLQQQLGRHHDLGVLALWLGELPRSAARHEVRRAVERSVRRLEERLLHGLEVELGPVPRFLEGASTAPPTGA